jgi:hypothetical protein
MFSRLNLIVKEHNSLNISNLDKGMINCKILMLIPRPKYNIINSMLPKEDLDKMEVDELVGEIRAHKMSVHGISEEATPSKSIALKAKTKKNTKLKMIKHESSSSEQDDDSSNDEDDDQELAFLMRKFSRLSDKIGKKGYSFNPSKKVFRPRRDDKNKTCYNCGEKGHISPNCSKPVMSRSSSKNKQVQESSDDEEDNHKSKNKTLRGRKTITRSPNTLQRRRAIPREALWLELKNGSPMSPQVKMSQVKIKTLSVSPSPTMKFQFHHCLCASWLKVTQR